MEKKEKQAVWLYPRTKELMVDHLKAANATSQSDFIEKAIRFYSGYLDCNSSIATEYLAHVLTSIIDGIVKGRSTGSTAGSSSWRWSRLCSLTLSRH